LEGNSANLNPIRIIVKLTNIFGAQGAETEKSKGGEDWMSAPPLRRIG
jgi:hypothetical protein